MCSSGRTCSRASTLRLCTAEKICFRFKFASAWWPSYCSHSSTQQTRRPALECAPYQYRMQHFYWYITCMLPSTPVSARRTARAGPTPQCLGQLAAAHAAATSNARHRMLLCFSVKLLNRPSQQCNSIKCRRACAHVSRCVDGAGTVKLVKQMSQASYLWHVSACQQGLPASDEDGMRRIQGDILTCLTTSLPYWAYDGLRLPIGTGKQTYWHQRHQNTAQCFLPAIEVKGGCLNMDHKKVPLVMGVRTTGLGLAAPSSHYCQHNTQTQLMHTNIALQTLVMWTCKTPDNM